MKNRLCKTEDGRYELVGRGGYPIDITERIEEEGCECNSENTLINPNPKKFDSKQLLEIREELPKWAIKNIKDFSEKDKEKLTKELNALSEEALLKKLKYRYSFFPESSYNEVPIYTIKVSYGLLKSEYAYCPNYKEVYDNYNNKNAYPVPKYDKYKVIYPIIENEEWAENEFGRAGVVFNNQQGEYLKERIVYKTHEGKEYTKEEWRIYEEKQYNRFRNKG